MNDDFYAESLLEFLQERANEYFTVKRFFAHAWLKKAQQAGFVPKCDRVQELLDYLERQIPEPISENGHIIFEIPEEFFDLEASTLSPSDHIDIEIVSDDVREYSERFDRLIENFTEKIPTTFGIETHKRWKEQALEIVNSEKEANSWMHARILEYWGEALDLLELLVVTSLNLGDELNERHRTSTSPKYVSTALARLHARACQVSQEIVHLLRGGYADGAHARWRTLHELNVISEYIAKHGEQMAERYLDHGIVEIYKTRDMYQRDAALLGEEPMPKDVYAEIGKEYTKAKVLYGARFADVYGWAASPGKDKRGKELSPTFDMLEAEVDLKHMRFFYRMANANVHAGSRGVQYRLSAWEASDDLMTGPSFFGIGVPARNTAYSISRITINMLGIEERLTSLVSMVAIHKLLEEVSDVFYTAQWELDRIDYLHTLSKELFEAHANKKHEETKRLIEELERAGATIEYQ